MLMLISLSLAATKTRAAELTVEDASTRVVNGIYLVDAHISVELSEDAREAIANGIPVTIMVDVTLKRRRKYLWDPKVASLSQGFRIEHHALTNQYLLVNLITGERRNFQSLENAIDALGTVTDLPVIDSQRLRPTQTYIAQIRARLDVEALPVPLRPVAYLSSDWRVSSEWYEWEIKH